MKRSQVDSLKRQVPTICDSLKATSYVPERGLSADCAGKEADSWSASGPWHSQQDG